MRKFPKPTLKDVARRAGVAVSTVSRYLNGNLALPGQTQARIRDAVAELRYRPNALARSLQSGESRILGLVVPDLVNQFFAVVAEAAADEAHREGYSLVACVTGQDHRREESCVSLLAAGQLDGLIYLGAHRKNAALQDVAHRELPILIVDEEIECIKGSRLFVANRRGGYLATEHLLHLGHRDVAFIGGEPSLLTTVERRLGYEDALRERGLRLDPEVQLLGDYTIDFGTRAGETLLARAAPPTAIFAASDILAMGVLRAARRAGLAVPEDLSLVGFDDVPAAELLLPALTTVNQPAEDLGRTAVTMLVAQLRGGAEIEQRTLPVSLKVRGSTVAPRRS